MSGLSFWPWLGCAAALHLAVVLVAAPRPVPRPEVRVRVATAVSFRTANAPSPALAPSFRAAPAAAPAPSPALPSSSAASSAEPAASDGHASLSTEDGPGGQGKSGPDPVGAYLAALRQTVADRKSYPYAARTRRQEGTVLLAFRLDQAGGLAGEPHVLQSSGYPRLDAAAVEAVKVASPFVPPPEAARPWEFRLPVEFVVR